MSHYRIYLLTDHRRIGGVREVDCADDEAALEHAGKAMSGYAGAEIWQRDRLVGALPIRRDGRDGDR